MIQFAAGLSILGEAIGLVTKLIESPETYDKLEGLRSLISKLVGKEIPKAGLVALLEEATQGEAYSGKWEQIDKDDKNAGARLRVAGGWIYDIGRGNGIHVHDPS